MPRSPFSLDDKGGFGGFTDSPHPYKQETRGLVTIRATSFFPWWLLLFFQEKFEAKQILKSGKILRNHRPDI